jgi:hypothetical protein
MLNKNTIILIVSFTVLPFCSLFAQDTLTSLNGNAVIRQFLKASKQVQARKSAVAAVGDTLSLPFLDDFSGKSIYPNQKLWLDSNVYINSNYPINPISVGVATFDGTNKFGNAYRIDLPNQQGAADSLTSKPINLKPAVVIDSVYLSFYYEAGGYGNSPEFEDSLLVQFRVSGGVWTTIKKITNANNHIDSTFTQVLIKVDTAYYKNGFQFRFKNYATLSGELDHWHIDYVRLDKDRKYNDFYLEDVGFTQPVTNLLNNGYTAMPWGHYAAANTATSITVKIKNVSNPSSLAKNVNYNYTVSNSSGVVLYSPSSSARNVPSGANDSIQSVFGFQFPVAPGLHDTATFVMKNMITTTPDNIRQNDTITHYQHFKNYYAYDDGTAENGYGLNTTGGKLAYKFNIAKADTLRGVEMFFDQLLYDLHERNMKITVWSSLNPETVIYQSSNYDHPVYTNSINWFNTYVFPNGIPVSGTIYVGWVQYTADILNVGFDKSVNNGANIYYNTNTGWLNTTQKGTLMIRPLVGDKVVIPTGIDDLSANNLSVDLYPNPAKDKLFIKQNNSNTSLWYELYDLQGKVLIKQKLTNEFIDVSSLSDGLYLLRLIDTKGNSFSKKVLINK